jgi:plasmid maintenance system antidote protein VapI
MEQQIIIQKIMEYLEKTNTRQYELANRLGAPPSTVNRWLKGKGKISKAYQTVLKSKGII